MDKRLRDLKLGDKMLINSSEFTYIGHKTNRILGYCKRFSDGKGNSELFNDLMGRQVVESLTNGTYRWIYSERKR